MQLCAGACNASCSRDGPEIQKVVVVQPIHRSEKASRKTMIWIQFIYISNVLCAHLENKRPQKREIHRCRTVKRLKRERTASSAPETRLSWQSAQDGTISFS